MLGLDLKFIKKRHEVIAIGGMITYAFTISLVVYDKEVPTNEGYMLQTIRLNLVIERTLVNWKLQR